MIYSMKEIKIRISKQNLLIYYGLKRTCRILDVKVKSLTIIFLALLCICI